MSNDNVSPEELKALDEWETTLQTPSEFAELDAWESELPTINPRELPIEEETTLLDSMGEFVKEEVPQLGGAMYGAYKASMAAPTLPHPILGPAVKVAAGVGGAFVGGFGGQAATETYKVLSDDPNKPADLDVALVRSYEAGKEEAFAELLGQTIFGVSSTGYNLIKAKLTKPSEGLASRLATHEKLMSHGGGLNAAQVVDNSIFHTVSSLVRFAPIGKETLGELDVKNQQALNNWGENLIGAFAKVSSSEMTEQGLARTVLTTVRDTDQLYRAVSGEMYETVDNLMLTARGLEPARYIKSATIGPRTFKLKLPKETKPEIIREFETAQRLVGYEDIKDVMGMVTGKKPVYVEEELLPPMWTDVVQPRKTITITQPGRAAYKGGDVMKSPATGWTIMRPSNKVVDLSNLKDYADTLIQASERIGKIGYTKEAGDLISRLSNLNTTLSFSDAHHLRSNIVALRNVLAEDIGTSRAEAIVNEATGKITQAMGKAMNEFGDKNTKQLYDKAKKMYREGSDTVNKKYLRKLFGIMEEDDLQAVGKALYSANNAADIRKLKSVLKLREKLAPKGFESNKILGEFQGAWLQEAFKESYVEGTDFFNPKVLERIFSNKKTNAVYKELFPEGPKRKLIEDFVKAAKTSFRHEDPEMGWIVKYAQTSAVFGIAPKLGQTVVGVTAGGALWDTFGAFGTAAFVLKTPALAGKYLANPKKVKALSTLVKHDPSKAMIKGGVTAKALDSLWDAITSDYEGADVSYQEKQELTESLKSEEETALGDIQMQKLGF